MRFKNLALGFMTAAMGIATSLVGCFSDDTATSATSTSTGATMSSTSSGECPLTDSSCNVVKSDCLALADNGMSMQIGFRMSQIKISRPPNLASQFIRDTVKTDSWPAEPACGLSAGKGVFNWLLQFDLANKKLTTGGAKPVTDPTKGYQFVNEMLMGHAVAPLVADITLMMNTDKTISFDASMGADVIVPAFTDMTGTAAILLPLHKAKLFMSTISADHNCIGSFDGKDLKKMSMCQFANADDAFVAGGKLSAYILLTEADNVQIPLLAGESLCVLLTGQPAGTPHCDMTDMKTYKGDWCSMTDMPADANCHDAFELGADFAASAVKINP